jgi:hypothetical protein
MALRPFFIVSSTASVISFLALHLTQYPSGIKEFHPGASNARSGNGGYLTGGLSEASTWKTAALKPGPVSLFRLIWRLLPQANGL